MRPVTTVWWLGYWRAGEHLYWWTTAVSPDAGRDELRAAVRARVRPSVWQRTTDPGRGAGAAFAAAGAVPWNEVQPYADALTAAVPVRSDPAVRAEQADLTRRLRRQQEIREMAPAVSDLDDEQRAGLIVEQIDLNLRRRHLHHTAIRESLDRSWSGPLVDPGAGSGLFRALGDLLLPDLLRDHLSAGDPTGPSTTVVIAPAPELGHVPWDLLLLDDRTHLIERATLRGGISPATVADLALPAAPDRPDLPGLLALDPTAGRDGGPPIYPDGLPDAWTRSTGDVVVGRPPAGSDGIRGCSRDRLSELLRSRPWGRFLFHGHVTADDVLSPTAAALALGSDPGGPAAPITTADGRAPEEPGATGGLSARIWLHDPARWPMPRRVGFVACQADDAGYVEQTGLTLAALNAGARIVTSTRWPLPGDATAALPGHRQAGPTTALALAVDDALTRPDPVGALRTWQLAELDAWRDAPDANTRRAHAPLLWAAPVTYVLPDRIAVTPIGQDT